MPRTYEPIASQTLGSDASFIEFTSIAATWTDLVLVLTGRTSRTATADEAVMVRFNSDSGSNYSLTNLIASGASVVSQRASNQTGAEWGRMNTSSSSNTTPSVSILTVQSYANTNVNKTALGVTAASQEAFGVARYVSLWRSTSAITAIRVYPALGPDFKSGATASLYGIKAA